jgi:AraC family transcriptional regulator
MPLSNPPEREISERFGIPAPTLISALGNATPLAFSRLKCETPGQGPTKAPRLEDAYSVHIMLQQSTKMRLWLNGREEDLPTMPKGSVIIGYLETKPVAEYQSSFDFLRVYITKAALDELSETAFGNRSEGLRRPDYGDSDPVLFSLASAAAVLVGRRLPEDQLLLDQLALAFHAHISQAYAGSPRDARPSSSGGLAPWQERRAKDYFEANLTQTASLSEVARACGLSPAHFARSFRASTGRPPHQWLLERRVEAAKRALKTTATPLSEISKNCGFSDPSHFSRIFSKATGEAPAAWRRAQIARKASEGQRRPDPLPARSPASS